MAKPEEVRVSQSQSIEHARMSVEEQWEFFRGPLHAGAITRTLHYSAVVPLIAWVAVGNHWLLVIGIALAELGHIYDLLFRFDAQTRAQARQVVWLQVVGGAIGLTPYLVAYLVVQASFP